MTASKVSKAGRAGGGENQSQHDLLFTVAEGDIKSFRADAVAFKYAQGFSGAEAAVVSALDGVGVKRTKLRPGPDEYFFTETKGVVAAPHALFVGTEPLVGLNYKHVRQLSARTLEALADEAPEARSLAMTTHGVNTGLDEVEATLALFGGFLDSIRAGRVPPMLEKITIVDRDARRVERIRAAFDRAFKIADYATRAGGSAWAYRLSVRPPERRTSKKKKKKATARPAASPAAAAAVAAATAVEEAGTQAKAKPHVFVAMPFKEETEDVFSYGIQNSVHAIDYLCERIDQEAFTGDILTRLKKRIETSSVVIADLTGDNPNVFLEVGYAWGKGRPTVLVVKDEQQLRFDVQGERCIKYKTIKSLETALTKMLKGLKSNGDI